MSNTQQWIPLSGPGSRLPTKEDGDDDGYIWMLFGDKTKGRYLSRMINTGVTPTHFCPIPKAPPLPKPVELSQEEKDYEAGNAVFKSSGSNYRDCILAVVRYGRADGRKALAQEALALFGIIDVKGVLEELSQTGLTHTAKSIERSHELLTEAART